MNYSEFLESKAQLSGSFGFDPIWIPDRLFDFQKYITEWGLKKGRGAYYADTGLGKTIIQLVTAENIVRHTNGNVLILTPLAVAFQFVKEAKTIDMDIYHSKDGTIKSKITVTNYERLHYFDSNDFEGVILDESSILKNFDGAYKTQITEFMKKIKYRYLSTATPSPNDCMNVISEMGNDSIDLSAYSPPFADLYKYSSSENDFSNNSTKQGFIDQYEFLVKEMARVTKPGRINAVHCEDIVDSAATHNLWDLPHEIIKLHEQNGFLFKNRITIWKEPLKVRIRTMVKSLMHKTLIEDSTKVFTAIPDYVLIFVRKGENKVPVTHENGLKIYYGETPILPNMLKAYNNANDTTLDASGLWKKINTEYYDKSEPKTNKLSHYIFQRYASSVWDDIRNDNVLPFKESKEEDDEKHVHALQLDIIERLITLYSNPGEVVFTPFMGVGSEVYGAIINGRKGIGIELKESYFKQAILNLKDVKREVEKQTGFDF